MFLITTCTRAGTICIFILFNNPSLDAPSSKAKKHSNPMPIYKRFASSCLIFLFAITAAPTLTAQEYTRGVGIYPGDVNADFSPAMKIDATTYRNLALHRPAYQSSSYDYNCTAQ